MLADSKLDDVRVFPLNRSGCGVPPGSRTVPHLLVILAGLLIEIV